MEKQLAFFKDLYIVQKDFDRKVNDNTQTRTNESLGAPNCPCRWAASHLIFSMYLVSQDPSVDK